MYTGMDGAIQELTLSAETHLVITSILKPSSPKDLLLKQTTHFTKSEQKRLH